MVHRGAGDGRVGLLSRMRTKAAAEAWVRIVRSLSLWVLV